MRQNRSYTYELLEQSHLLSLVRVDLKSRGEDWEMIAECMPLGHIEYRPIRNNPMRSGYPFHYRKAGLNLTLYLPEKDFNFLLEVLDRARVLELKSAFQSAIPERSGYTINEFKIRGILAGPGPGEK